MTKPDHTIVLNKNAQRNFSLNETFQAGIALEGWEVKSLRMGKVDAKDTLGAGDVWHGAFALSLAEGNNEIEAVKFANSAASLKCSVFGGRKGIPFRHELENFIKETQ